MSPTWLRPTIPRAVKKATKVQGLWHYVLTALTTIAFVFTAALGGNAISAASVPIFRQFATTVAVLRILQGTTSALSTFVLSQTLEMIQWGLVNRDNGLRLLTFLSISPTTGIFGMLGLLCLKKPYLFDRIWVLARLVLMAMAWTAGIVLFVNTKVSAVYDPYYTFPTLAGAAPFNGSFVEEILRKLQPAPTYQVLVSSNNFVTNPEFATKSSPVSCTGECDSYIFPGAMWSLNSSLPVNSSANAFAKIANSPAIQMDFVRGLPTGDMFTRPDDCTVYGEEGGRIGVMLCVAKSESRQGSIIAEITVCSNIMSGSCISGSYPLRIDTTLTIYSRTATAACSVTNNSIMSVTDIGPPTLHEIDIQGLSLALNWLLNYTHQGIPAVSSLAFMFSNGEATPSGYPIWAIGAYQSLKSVLAFPLWVFSVNNVGDPLKSSRTLPPEFHTTASLCRSLDKIVLNTAPFAAYVALQAAVILFFWAVIVWRWVYDCAMPNLSSYPLIDFAAKCVRAGPSLEHTPICSSEREFLRDAGTKEIIKILREVRILQRAKSGDPRARKLISEYYLEPDRQDKASASGSSLSAGSE